MKFLSRFGDTGLRALLLLFVILGGIRLTAVAADPYVVGTVVDKAQLNKNYDSGNKWYLYQWYTRTAAIPMASYDATTARNLVLEFNYYVEDLDSTDEVPEIFAGGNSKFDDYIELGYGDNNAPGFIWHFDRSAIRQGWNKVSFPFSAISDADWNAKFQAGVNFVWFRLALAHVKTDHAYLMRMSDVHVVDLEKVVPELRTEYDEPIMNGAKDWTGTVNVSNKLAFWSAVDYKEADGRIRGAAARRPAHIPGASRFRTQCRHSDYRL